MNKSKVISLILLLVLALGVMIFPLVAPDVQKDEGTSASTEVSFAENAQTTSTVSSEESTKQQKNDTQDELKVEEDGQYRDLQHVVLYIETYGKLPSNYITKKQAQDIRFNDENSSLDINQLSVGGDRFGNYERQLPSNARYTECDIDSVVKKRGAKRLVFSNDRRYYYTEDHYETFKEYVVVEGRVEMRE